MSKVTITLTDRGVMETFTEEMRLEEGGPPTQAKVDGFAAACTRIANGQNVKPGTFGLTNAEIAAMVAMEAVETWKARNGLAAKKVA